MTIEFNNTTAKNEGLSFWKEAATAIGTALAVAKKNWRAFGSPEIIRNVVNITDDDIEQYFRLSEVLDEAITSINNDSNYEMTIAYADMIEKPSPKTIIEFLAKYDSALNNESEPNHKFYTHKTAMRCKDPYGDKSNYRKTIFALCNYFSQNNILEFGLEPNSDIQFKIDSYEDYLGWINN